MRLSGPYSCHILVLLLSDSREVRARLAQTATNGNSLFGDLSVPLSGDHIQDYSLPDGDPWGSATAFNTNYYNSSPDTGITRKYEWTVSRGVLAPDGYQKPMILVNGGFPGPLVEANWGDMIEITVHNDIQDPAEGTSIHWHGFLQHGSQWNDGIPAFTQCPISPGSSQTYRFKAELYGTSWWHAHYSAQYSAGVQGPIVVHGPKNSPYDIDMGPVMLSDWYHGDYLEIVKLVMEPHSDFPSPRSDSNLINGKMNFNCSKLSSGSSASRADCTSDAGYAQFQFEAGKSHRLRLVNSGAGGSQQFSIDEHVLTVMANDYVPVQPYDTKVVTLGIGQRTDVIVKAQGDPSKSYWMRSTITCSESSQPEARAIIYYNKAIGNPVPSATMGEAAGSIGEPQSIADVDNNNNNNNGCANDPLAKTIPAYPISVEEPDTTVTVTMSARQNETGNWLWYMNNSSYFGDLGDPILLLAKEGNASYTKPEWNVFNLGSNSSYRFIINNQSPIWHPMHFHGHNMFILAEGDGDWDGRIVNPSNPQRRDTQQVRPGGYMVWQATADNPGAWAFHCHIAWHLSSGMAFDVLERPDDIKKLAIPPERYQQCSEWAEWRRAIAPQIDSGV